MTYCDKSSLINRIIYFCVSTTVIFVVCIVVHLCLKSLASLTVVALGFKKELSSWTFWGRTVPFSKPGVNLEFRGHVSGRSSKRPQRGSAVSRLNSCDWHRKAFTAEASGNTINEHRMTRYRPPINVYHDGVRLHIKSRSILIPQTLSVRNARRFGENEKHLDLLMARKCGHFLPVSAKKRK